MDISCNITRVINKPDYDEGIEGAGTTDHFLKEEAPADNIKEAINPIEIEIPNGMHKTHTHTHTHMLP